MQLTDKNFAVFETLCTLIESGMKPRIQDVADVTDLSWATARYHLTRLEAAGLISRTPGKVTSIKIIQ